MGMREKGLISQIFSTLVLCEVGYLKLFVGLFVAVWSPSGMFKPVDSKCWTAIYVSFMMLPLDVTLKPLYKIVPKGISLLQTCHKI